MRIGQFRYPNESGPQIGLLEEDEEVIIDVATVADYCGVEVPEKTLDVLKLAEWKSKLETIQEVARSESIGWILQDDVETHAPVSGSRRVIGVGLNYRDHAAESGNDPPEEPVLFAKFASLTGAGSPITWDPAVSSMVDFEAELCVVIGRHGKNLTSDEGRECIAGYAPGNDVSARDLQRRDGQWTRGKSLSTFAPIGPAIVTPDEISDVTALDIWAEKNGTRFQDSSTDEMIFDVFELVSFCSRMFGVAPGDVIYTGTPAGVGVFQNPRELLDNGDTITVGIEGLGELSNQCTVRE
jgi:2-keto-4-pentenoate hydratase/2-oxohepta-3-ene-1,7-dioic acid hydratase in catechol pathway